MSGDYQADLHDLSLDVVAVTCIIAAKDHLITARISHVLPAIV